MSEMVRIYCYNYDFCKSSTLVSTKGYDDRFGTYPIENLTNNFKPISNFKSKDKELLNKDNNYWHLNIPRAIGLTMLISYNNNTNVFFSKYTLCEHCSKKQETLEAFQ